jgi:hypothetical protein
MTTSAAFSAEKWTSVLEGPPSAGMIVVTAVHGGMFRETIAMSKAYAEAREPCTARVSWWTKSCRPSLRPTTPGTALLRSYETISQPPMGNDLLISMSE